MASERRPNAILTHIRGLFIIIPWLLYLLLADIALSILLPLKRLFPDLVYNTSSSIASSVWRAVQIIFERLNGGRITISGDRIPHGESAIVISNHVSWSDFYMIQALAIKMGMLGRCRYFAKSQLKKIPFLGWGLWAMGMPLVSRNWQRDRAELERVFAPIVKRRWPIWLISFSEGTRFTHKKYNESEMWCQQRGHTQPKHLLYPRTKGFVTTVQQLRNAPQVKAVYDLTIAYQRGEKFLQTPSMWDTLRLPGLSSRYSYRFHIHVRRFLLEDVPTTQEELEKWLEARWVEKGEWLDQKMKEWAPSAEQQSG